MTMWRSAFSHLQTQVALRRRAPLAGTLRSAVASLSAFRRSSPLSSSSESRDPPAKKRVDDIMPIATGLEREELEAELEVRRIRDFVVQFSEGFEGSIVRCRGGSGSIWILRSAHSEAPTVVPSYSDKRIVGCPGGEGEDEHDVVWFWLEKDKPYECPVCSQYFVLKVIGKGGPPDGQ